MTREEFFAEFKVLEGGTDLDAPEQPLVLPAWLWRLLPDDEKAIGKYVCRDA